MADTPPFFWGLVGLGIGLFGFIMGLRYLFFRRMIENIPTSKVRSIAMGLVEVYGKVVPVKMLKSPFSGKDCVYYRYQIEELHSDGKRSYWVTVRKEDGSTPFLLKDETGSVIVDCTGASVDIKLDSRFESGMGHDPPSQVLSFLKANKIAHDSFLGFNKHMRYTEWFIAPEDKLYIMGTAAESRSGIPGPRHTENIVIRKGENDKTFYVSDKSEKEILSSLRWKILLGVFGGAALTVGCLAFLVFSLQVGIFF
jgi:hypothetical protein